MTYFSHLMSQSIRPQPQPHVLARTKLIRSMPGNAPAGPMVVSSMNPNSSADDRYRYKVMYRKLLFMRSLIRAQVFQILASPAPHNIHTTHLFANYQINTNKRVYEDQHLKIYRARYSALPTFPVMVRIYSRQELDPNSIYLKILRHLGCKHPKLVYTFDIFFNATSLYVFQEFVAQGNLMEYLEKNPDVSEAQARFWAKQLFDSLDFLGDQAIAHRNLTPKNLLVKKAGCEQRLKLTGFQCAIIYWDMATNDIQFCPCWPAQNQKTDGPNFQAPEVYGDSATEEFDPILADTWSYGANVYYMLAKQYPYNVFGSMEDLDGEILANIHRLSTLSPDGKNFLSSIMQTNANNRMPFELIGHDPWIQPMSEFAKENQKTMLKAECKSKISRFKTADAKPSSSRNSQICAGSRTSTTLSVRTSEREGATPVVNPSIRSLAFPRTYSVSLSTTRLTSASPSTSTSKINPPPLSRRSPENRESTVAIESSVLTASSSTSGSANMEISAIAAADHLSDISVKSASETLRDKVETTTNKETSQVAVASGVKERIEEQTPTDIDDIRTFVYFFNLLIVLLTCIFLLNLILTM